MTKWMLSVLSVIFLVMSVLLLRLIVGSDAVTGDEAPVEEIRYHLQIILQEDQGYSISQFKKGAKDAGDDFGAYIEFISVDSKDTDVLLELSEKALYSKVDGFAMQAFDSEVSQKIANELKSNGVSVVVYESWHSLENIHSIRSNRFIMGVMAGEMALDAADGDIKAAVILNSSTEEGESLFRNNIIQGIQDTFKKAVDIRAEIVTINNLGNGLFQAEKIVESIMEESEDLNTIICFDEHNTPAITQILVDTNQLKDLKIIGYGILPQTLDYIDRGVIYGVLSPDSYGIGYETVEALAQLLNNDTLNNEKFRQSEKVTKSNLSEYIDEIN